MQRKRESTYGRPKAEITDEYIAEYTRWKNGEITATQAMRNADTKRNTFYKLAKMMELERV